jgi:phosphohistidine phosphatase
MPKTLYLVRHAKSSWAEAGLGDYARPLNQRGLRDAQEMGQRLKARKVYPDLILCSPAKRTRETLDQLIQEIGGPMDIVRFDESIYEASAETLLNLAQSLPEPCASAMFIGHNPSIGRLANQLSDAHIERMPTCAIATLGIASHHWRDIGSCPTRLLAFDSPKNIK